MAMVAPGGTMKAEQAAAGPGEQIESLAAGNDLASLKSETAGLLKDLKKVMRKLRETALHPGIEKKERAEMESMLAEAERAFGGLQAAVLPAAGGAIDLSA